MAFGSNQTFEPRVGTAQLIFGVIYTLITLIALVLALYVRQTNDSEPWLHYFMAGLFAIMALKSFIIHARVKKLLQSGVYYEAQVESCEPVRGITIIKGTCDVKDYGLIHIESRLVGESAAHELNRYLQEHKQKTLPALVVGENTTRPRGMFTVKCLHGHLIEESAQLKDPTKTDADTNNAKAQQEANAKSTSVETSSALGESSPVAVDSGNIADNVANTATADNASGSSANPLADDELAAIEKTKQEQAAIAQELQK